MDDRLVEVLASLGFTAIHHDGDLSLWAAEDLRRVVRVRRSPDSVEIELLQDARYVSTARGPLDAALLRGIASDLAAHERLEVQWDSLANELQARYRGDHHTLDRTWKRGAGSLRGWAAEVANELQDALVGRARPGP